MHLKFFENSDWEWFQSFPSDLVSARIIINLRGGDKLEHDFITLVLKLVTSKVKP
jgi:hypothetical protein